MTTRTTPIDNGQRPQGGDRNGAALIRVSFVFAVSLFLASHYPPALVPAVFQTMLFLAATVSAAIAMVARQPLFAGHLTRWDEGAALALAAYLAGFFIDHQAALAALESLSATAT